MIEPTEAEFRQMYLIDKLSANKIAERCGRSPGWALLRLQRYHIPIRDRHEAAKAASRRKDSYYLDKVMLERMHLRQARTMADIAATLGCSYERVRDSLEHHGIERQAAKSVQTAKTHLPASTVISCYVDRRWSIERCAAYFGVAHQRISELLRENGVRIRGQNRDESLPQRAVDHLEQVQVGVAFDGKPKTAITAILSCGHKHPVHRRTTMQTDLSGVKFRCRACRNLEEKSHG